MPHPNILLASYGARHLRVSKSVVEERAFSAAKTLSPEERGEELALMLGGALTEATRRNAEELLKRAAEGRL